MDNNGISCIKWMDTKAVTIVSNMHDPSENLEINRKNKDGSTQLVEAPKMVKHYMQHMGCVDKADMLKSLYELDRKSTKWRHQIFFHLMDVTLVNSMIL